MKKKPAKKAAKKAPVKRAAGKRLRNFAFKDEDVERWKAQAEKENRTLTNWLETAANERCAKSE